MVIPKALGLLLLLALQLLASVLEDERNACEGIINMGQYDSFELQDTANCFEKCRQEGSKSCHLGNLHSYWLNYELYLVENNVKPGNTSFLKALVKNISTNVTEDLYFSLTPSKVPSEVTEAEHGPPDRVRLPQSLFTSLRGSRSEVRLAITILDIGMGDVFKGPNLKPEDGSSVWNNRLVGLSLGRVPVAGLTDPVEITFSHQQQPSSMTFSCVFWDANKGDWSSKGCLTKQGPKQTVCHCDHLTFFTLLLRPILDKATVLALTRTSQAGCGASMFFLALTIGIYTALRLTRQRFKSEDAPKIHVALSVSLFLLNLAFFFSVGPGSRVSNPACWLQGALLHYFLLCTFTWMGLEAFHLYLLVIKVFNTYFGHYFLKLSLVGWGLPALVVIGTGISNSYGYFTIRDQDNRITLELCWFSETTQSARYITVHGYFLVTFLCSAMVLGLVAWKIFTLSSTTAGKEQGQSWKGVLTVLGLSSLVGMTWGLAILTPLGLPATYAFALFNSLQGVFIFCWFVVLYFPGQKSTASSSGTARLDQAHSMSQE
ncbi:adhesion G protein-coupled receptor G3 isoform X1 [Erinaceus europaeus]|uniref:Adhesion G protein-coupled receptor G3 isoform X1 n=1 Tax=Erinaceus europaeus TaxID=9365 RepID=A0A1S2ZJ97_ERIEU|nr:adhesion G protein-coupled receptor G3 isoform X1 [Erinaceus europaeus]